MDTGMAHPEGLSTKHTHKTHVYTCRRVLLMDKHRLERCHRACLGCAFRSMANASMMTLSTSLFGCPTLKEDRAHKQT